mgnify:CR=1 FL=1|jgi:hypothetical protein|tara:strand:+ start:533 stop:1117 length:585 start_codon:yes stop_codon:yes gene_type:complete
MSRLAFRSPETSPVPIETTAVTASHHIILEATVKPIGTSTEYNKDRVAQQASALKELRQSGKDLFETNETRKVQSAGTVLYQTTETYGTAISIEKMVETMLPNDLTLRVNFNRPGKHSNTTCMELSAQTLQRLVATDADSHGHKIAELRIRAEKTVSTPRHGSLYVAIQSKGAQHYLSHIDYKIMSAYDALYHE